MVLRGNSSILQVLIKFMLWDLLEGKGSSVPQLQCSVQCLLQSRCLLNAYWEHNNPSYEQRHAVLSCHVSYALKFRTFVVINSCGRVRRGPTHSLTLPGVDSSSFASAHSQRVIWEENGRTNKQPDSFG